jgi:hypothetical protein
MAASFPKPVIFLGYVVTEPHAPRREYPLNPGPPLDVTPLAAAPYEIITEDGKVFDIDKDDTDRW